MIFLIKLILIYYLIVSTLVCSYNPFRFPTVNHNSLVTKMTFDEIAEPDIGSIRSAARMGDAERLKLLLLGFEKHPVLSTTKGNYLKTLI